MCAVKSQLRGMNTPNDTTSPLHDQQRRRCKCSCLNTNYGFIIYTQVRMTKLLVMSKYKLRLHYVYTSQDDKMMSKYSYGHGAVSPALHDSLGLHQSVSPNAAGAGVGRRPSSEGCASGPPGRTGPSWPRVPRSTTRPTAPARATPSPRPPRPSSSRPASSPPAL